jgi:hypothetical protein
MNDKTENKNNTLLNSVDDKSFNQAALNQIFSATKAEEQNVSSSLIKQAYNTQPINSNFF